MRSRTRWNRQIRPVTLKACRNHNRRTWSRILEQGLGIPFQLSHKEFINAGRRLGVVVVGAAVVVLEGKTVAHAELRSAKINLDDLPEFRPLGFGFDDRDVRKSRGIGTVGDVLE